jgi:hypothetical protein
MRSQRFLFVAFVCAVFGARADAQWTVINLQPAGVPGSLAYGVQGGQQVGNAVVGAETHATWWSGSAASMVDLHPGGADWSECLGVGDGQQVGRARFSNVWHASLWSGTAASRIDLAPDGAVESAAQAARGGQQVGWANLGSGSRVSLWSGTKASWVDLTPTGATRGAALGVNAGQQVGWSLIGGVNHAGMWSGTAGSWVDLDPAGSIGSDARDTDAGQQVGDMTDTNYWVHASLWTGSAATWVDLSPAGTFESIAYGVHAGKQVGFVNLGGLHQAFVWSGTAESGVNLHPFLPPGYIMSEARDIWTSDGVTYIAGFAQNFETGMREAMLWVSSGPVCTPPDQAIQIYAMHKSTDGNFRPILDFQDPNQPTQVSGYNVYRSSTPAPAPSTWPRVAFDVVDMDAVTPNNQWVDTSGDLPPAGIWYFQVTAYDNRCPAQTAEGPF